VTTFPGILARLLAADPARPLVTFYDDTTGERTELSVKTWATWVAKVSSLLADELEVEHGDRLLVELPAHWLGTVVLGAAWGCGIEVVWEGEFEETQESLSANFFDWWIFWDAGPRWLSASELAGLGVDQLLKECQASLTPEAEDGEPEPAAKKDES